MFRSAKYIFCKSSSPVIITLWEVFKEIYNIVVFICNLLTQRTGKDNRSYDCLILKSFERMDVPANGWASRSNGWMFLTNGWVSRSNGWTFLSNGWASRSNGWMLLPNGWASHSNGWTFLSNGWSSRSNGCKFFWTDDPGRSNECKFLSNGFQTGSKRNSVRKRKAVIARFRVKGHIYSDRQKCYVIL